MSGYGVAVLSNATKLRHQRTADDEDDPAFFLILGGTVMLTFILCAAFISAQSAGMQASVIHYRRRTQGYAGVEVDDKGDRDVELARL